MTDTPSEDNEGFDRRKFLKRVGVVGVFAVPAITTFSMTGLGEAFGSPSPLPPRGANLGGDPSDPTATSTPDPAATPTSAGTTTTAPAPTAATAAAPSAATESNTRSASIKPKTAPKTPDFSFGGNQTIPIHFPGNNGNQSVGNEIESLLQQIFNFFGFGKKKI